MKKCTNPHQKDTYTRLSFLFFKEHYPEKQDELMFDWTATKTHCAAVKAGSESMTEENKVKYVAAVAEFAKNYKR